MGPLLRCAHDRRGGRSVKVAPPCDSSLGGALRLGVERGGFFLGDRTMARSITFSLAALGFVAATGWAASAKADLVDFDFSGTITSRGPANLLPDVNVGDAISGSGSLTTFPGSDAVM